MQCVHRTQLFTAQMSVLFTALGGEITEPKSIMTSGTKYGQIKDNDIAATFELLGTFGSL